MKNGLCNFQPCRWRCLECQAIMFEQNESEKGDLSEQWLCRQGVSLLIELLNSNMPGGFLDFNFELKVCCPVMLLRKLLSGLVNRTRVLVRRLHAKVLECEVFTGTSYGQVVFIPRIPMVDRSGEFPWTMTRVQFPVRVCFAMTFHKGQGQSLSKVGLNI